MPSAKGPTASALQKKETPVAAVEDVKSELPESSTEEEPEEKAEVEAAEVEEDDLKRLEELKKVPYQRFKEVNEKAKAAERRMAELEAQKEQDIRRAVEDAEIRAKARIQAQIESSQDEETSDPYERRMNALEKQIAAQNAELEKLRGTSEHQGLQSRLERLEKKYPEADTLAVLGWAKSQKGSDLEELMERSHNTNVERVQAGIQKILEQKKAQAKQAIPTRSVGFRLKESERPKNLKDSMNLMKKYFGN